MRNRKRWWAGALLAAVLLAGCTQVPTQMPGATSTVAATSEALTVPAPTEGPAATLAPAKTASSTPEVGQPTPMESPTVTLDDDGKTLNLAPGQRFLLKLGEEFNWEVAIDNQDVVSRVIGVLPVRGAQGIFEARKDGRTILTATGDPLCRSAQPPCAAPSRVFTLKITVSE